jgi:hypothetical protein
MLVERLHTVKHLKPADRRGPPLRALGHPGPHRRPDRDKLAESCLRLRNAGFLELLTNTRLITGLFTWFVQGAFCFAVFVLPRWQEAEVARVKELPVRGG